MALRINANKRTFNSEDFLSLWANILKRYAAASLTFHSDILPAISGVARHLQNLTGIAYLAGVWKRPGKEFLAHLGWICKPYAPRPAEYRAPSWSWASTDNPVTLHPMKVPAGSIKYDESGLCNLQPGANVVEAQVVPATSDHTVSISSEDRSDLTPI